MQKVSIDKQTIFKGDFGLKLDQHPQLNLKRHHKEVQTHQWGGLSYLLYKMSQIFSELTSTYEGRDKLTKMMQYSSKLMSWYYREGDYLQSLKYLDVYDKFRESRSVFRLSKFLFEIKRIKIIYQVNDDKFS